MTQDEIIEMANQVGASPSSNPDEYDVLKITYCELEAFAKLVEEKAFKDGYAIGETAGFKQAIKLERARGQA